MSDYTERMITLNPNATCEHHNCDRAGVYQIYGTMTHWCEQHIAQHIPQGTRWITSRTHQNYWSIR
jgi:hypothetical protein